MKHPAKLLILCCLSLSLGRAQVDTVIVADTTATSVAAEPAIPFHTDTLPNDARFNAYGGLLDDDPEYTPRRNVFIPMSEVLLKYSIVWGINRWVFDEEWVRVSPETWKKNIEEGWEWDNDNFGTNFIGHPYGGALSFNAGRANGYNYFGSFLFSAGGSLMWEYFGETTRPSYNDIINTPINGSFLGEVMYRVSSNILDDRTTGGERFFRELTAGLIDPTRGFDRLVKGYTRRHVTEEIYQTEPLNVTLYGGIHKRGTEQELFTSDMNSVVSVQLDYGNPFEERHRKPFDLFRVRTELSFGEGPKIFDNLTGWGLLFGRASEGQTFSSMLGGFQYYDYWNNNVFEMASIAFGGAYITRLEFSENTNLYTSLHLGWVPLAGNSFERPDTLSEVRDYQYGTGAQGKFETTLNLGNRLTLRFNAYYYYVRALVESVGNNYIGILEPNVSLRLFKNLRLGFQHSIYLSDRYSAKLDTIRERHTQQRVFLLYFFENEKRRGKFH